MVTKNPNAPIGVFDSGIGGLTVLKSCIEAMPNERFIYLGDTARTPYGSKSHDTIRRYGFECANFLADQDIKFLVVACNTVCSHAFDELVSAFDCPVIGTIDPAIETALKATKNHHIGIIGTKATIAGGVYQKGLEKADPTGRVYAKACPLFVPLVEEGMVDGEIVDKVVELYLAEFKEHQVDSLILGCTHYPLLADAIQKFLGPEVTLVACSDAIADTVQAQLANDQQQNQAESHDAKYFVTDAVDRFDRLGTDLLGLKNVHSIQIDLS
jgi:glutamate racemase